MPLNQHDRDRLLVAVHDGLDAVIGDRNPGYYHPSTGRKPGPSTRAYNWGARDFQKEFSKKEMRRIGLHNKPNVLRAPGNRKRRLLKSQVAGYKGPPGKGEHRFVRSLKKAGLPSLRSARDSLAGLDAVRWKPRGPSSGKGYHTREAEALKYRIRKHQRLTSKSHLEKARRWPANPRSAPQDIARSRHLRHSPQFRGRNYDDPLIAKSYARKKL